MEVLTLQGKQYVKASKAAADLGYAKDYVGQLCRSGAVDAHLVGRTWYVNVDTLGTHRIEKKRNARVKAREYAKKSIEESKKLAVKTNTNTSQNIDIRYESDPESLIPKVKKVTVVSTVKHKVSADEVDDGPQYEVLNPNEKILMSGDLVVHDAEAEPVLTDVTYLTPSINRKRRSEKHEVPDEISITEEISEEEEENIDEIQEETPVPVHMSFSERLAEMDQEKVPEETHPEPAVQFFEEPVASERLPLKKGQVVFVYMLLLLSIVSASSLFIENIFEYSEGYYSHGYSISSEGIEKILDKI